MIDFSGEPLIAVTRFYSSSDSGPGAILPTPSPLARGTRLIGLRVIQRGGLVAGTVFYTLVVSLPADPLTMLDTPLSISGVDATSTLSLGPVGLAPVGPGVGVLLRVTTVGLGAPAAFSASCELR